jgi:uncharacterized protein (DUF924 family)
MDRGEPDLSAADVVAFWRAAGAERWFTKDAAFDRIFRDRFLALHRAVAARRHDDWIGTAEGALALLILTDQFPRNAFRDTEQMYATDPLARHYAQLALAAGHIARVEPALRVFFGMPFGHSEDCADQDVSMALAYWFDEQSKSYAEGHRAIIARFGRFPHRNAILGRETTAGEAAFLAEGGFAG